MLFIPAVIQIFGNYSCGGAQQSYPAAQQSHSFHFEGNRRLCLLRCTSATVSAVALLHDSISLRKASLHEKLTDTQTVKNKHYSLELAVFWKVYSCQSSGCFLRRVFPGFPLKRDPFPHTLVFFFFLSHLGPLQSSAAPLVPTPFSDLLPQPLDTEIPKVCKQLLKFPFAWQSAISSQRHLVESEKIQSQEVLDVSPGEAAWGLDAPTMVHDRQPPQMKTNLWVKQSRSLTSHSCFGQGILWSCILKEGCVQWAVQNTLGFQSKPRMLTAAPALLDDLQQVGAEPQRCQLGFVK